MKSAAQHAAEVNPPCRPLRDNPHWCEVHDEPWTHGDFCIEHGGVSRREVAEALANIEPMDDTGLSCLMWGDEQ